MGTHLKLAIFSSTSYPILNQCLMKFLLSIDYKRKHSQFFRVQRKW